MKKIIQLTLAAILITTGVKSQITLADTYQGSTMYVTKLGNAGYKYAVITSTSINLYNLNHTLFSSINLPATITSVANSFIVYISDNLFDLDNAIEYAAYIASPTPKVYIYKDNGTQLFFRDSSTIYSLNAGNAGDVCINSANIFSDGTGTKMRLGRTLGSAAIIKHEIYNLPGTLPCVQCSATGTTVGRPQYQNSNPEFTFYPNPVTDQLKLKYNLPKDYKSAEIKIQDVQGKLIDTFKITNDFDFIYVPSNYNNGLYLYSLYVDGRMIKTEKIVLDK